MVRAYRVFFGAVPDNRHSSTRPLGQGRLRWTRRPPAGSPWNGQKAEMMRLLATDLACTRGGREVFSDLGFAVAAGEALAVVGPNGAGKSSLLRLVAGLVHISRGRLALEGGDSELTVGEQAHYLGHLDPLKPSLSVRENLDFWTSSLGGRPAETEAASTAVSPGPR